MSASRRPSIPRLRRSAARAPRMVEPDVRLAQLAARLEDIAAAVAHLGARQEELMAAIQHAAEDEAGVRRLLRAVRQSPDYMLAWDEPEPLVSVCIPTHTRWRTLVERALPSVFAQGYPNLEVIVVGDAAGPETERALTRLGDPRVRFENLPVRGPYPADERALWFVAGTGPLNRAMELAVGRWIVVLNDDDALRPDHLHTLLDAARRTRAEVAYGTTLQHRPDGTTIEHRSFPPANHDFGWQACLQHAQLRMFEYELAAHVFGEPGDWHRARRMLRAGVRFHHVEHVVVDYWPGQLWTHE